MHRFNGLILVTVWDEILSTSLGRFTMGKEVGTTSCHWYATAFVGCFPGDFSLHSPQREFRPVLEGGS